MKITPLSFALAAFLVGAAIGDDDYVITGDFSFLMDTEPPVETAYDDVSSNIEGFYMGHVEPPTPYIGYSDASSAYLLLDPEIAAGMRRRGEGMASAKITKCNANPSGSYSLGQECWYNKPTDPKLGGPLSPTKQQGSCGDCWVVSALTAVEIWQNMLRAKQNLPPVNMFSMPTVSCIDRALVGGQRKQIQAYVDCGKTKYPRLGQIEVYSRDGEYFEYPSGSGKYTMMLGNFYTPKVDETRSKILAALANESLGLGNCSLIDVVEKPTTVCLGGWSEITIDFLYREQQRDRQRLARGDFLPASEDQRAVRLEINEKIDEYTCPDCYSSSAVLNNVKCAPGIADDNALLLSTVDPFYGTTPAALKRPLKTSEDSFYSQADVISASPLGQFAVYSDLNAYGTGTGKAPRKEWALMSIIAALQHGPLICNVAACDNFMNSKREVENHTPFNNCGRDNTKVYHPNHAIVVVGFNYTGDLDTSYFMIQNSWGISWGYRGHLKVRADEIYLTQCKLPLTRTVTELQNPLLPAFPEGILYSLPFGSLFRCAGVTLPRSYGTYVDTAPQEFNSIIARGFAAADFTGYNSASDPAAVLGDSSYCLGLLQSPVLNISSGPFFYLRAVKSSAGPGYITSNSKRFTNIHWINISSLNIGDVSLQSISIDMSIDAKLGADNDFPVVMVSARLIPVTASASAPPSFSVPTRVANWVSDPLPGAESKFVTASSTVSFGADVQRQRSSQYSAVHLMFTLPNDNSVKVAAIDVYVRKIYFKINSEITAQFRAKDLADISGDDETSSSANVPLIAGVVAAVVCIIAVVVILVVIVTRGRRSPSQGQRGSSSRRTGAQGSSARLHNSSMRGSGRAELNSSGRFAGDVAATVQRSGSRHRVAERTSNHGTMSAARAGAPAGLHRGGSRLRMTETPRTSNFMPPLTRNGAPASQMVRGFVPAQMQARAAASAPTPTFV